MSTETVTTQKFKPGDRIVEDLNKPDLPPEQRKAVLVRYGTVEDYSVIPGSPSGAHPFIHWDDNTCGYVNEATIKKAVDTSTDTSTRLDRYLADGSDSPTLNRLSTLETDIEKGLEVAQNALRQVQRAAFEIREDRLWEEAGYVSYLDYAQQRWGWKKTQAYAIASAGETFTGLLLSGVPESEIPQSTSTLNELAKAGGPEQQVQVIEEARQNEGSVTVASVRKTLKHTPSIELMVALWQQIGKVSLTAPASHPEQMVVETDTLPQPIVFDTVKESQQYWEQNGQRLCAVAVDLEIEPDPDAQQRLCNVPCEITSTSRGEEVGQHALLMGGWHAEAKDARGNQPKPWEYQVLLSGSPHLRSLHLFQVKILWEDTYSWQPQQSAPPPAPISDSAPPKENYQPQQVSPMYKAEDVRGQEKAAIAQKLPILGPFPQGSYSLIVADPPWQYHLREHDATHRGRTPYPTMSEEELLTLPMNGLAADDAYLLLWATNNHLPLAFDLLAVWGFTYKTTHTWVKVSSKTGNPQIGTGHYGRGCTEHLLIATKGAPGSFLTHGLTNIPTVMLASKQEHSKKPEIFWQTAQALKAKLGAGAIELFSRQKREGWEAWGLEL